MDKEVFYGGAILFVVILILLVTWSAVSSLMTFDQSPRYHIGRDGVVYVYPN